MPAFFVFYDWRQNWKKIAHVPFWNIWGMTVHNAIQQNYYNLDAILSVGYRVNSRNATLFRQWANNITFRSIILYLHQSLIS